MSELVPIEFASTDGKPPIQLALHRYVGDDAPASDYTRKPVLLLHGASGNHQTFTIPNGGLAGWLARNGFDPYLLDWRGSSLVVDDPRNRPLLLERAKDFNFNRAAQYDVPDAIAAIRQHIRRQVNDNTVEPKIGALGFCMGSGILAESVARTWLHDVDRIVLMTLGLFYETAIDGRLKCEDRVLERLEETKKSEQPFLSVDPRLEETGQLRLRAQWPDDLESMYQSWPAALKSHAEGSPPSPATDDGIVTCMCNRLSFMYGAPYNHANLVEEIHGSASSPGKLPELFGAIPLHMYIHGARNIRQGHATSYDPKAPLPELLSAGARENFLNLSRVTLITGAYNRLWHRNSVDLMYEWLCRGASSAIGKCSKVVFPKYGHQDLLWGRHSDSEVFPAIKAGLQADPQPEMLRSASVQRLPSHGIPSAEAAISPRP